jgi:hypothetical protein
MRSSLTSPRPWKRGFASLYVSWWPKNSISRLPSSLETWSALKFSTLTMHITLQAMCAFVPTTPFNSPDFKKSTHKTFADCYLMRGFVGGLWGYVLDGNDTNGVEINSSEISQSQPDDSPTVTLDLLKDEERRLALYCLGWESIEVSAMTPLSRWAYLHSAHQGFACCSLPESHNQ